MAKPKIRYICSSCGHEHLKWNGRCQSCGEWNTLEETVVEGKTAVSLRASEFDYSSLSEIEYIDEHRYDTGIRELNRVLGGGLVKGSLVLLGGDPGIGKSTLMLQICKYLGQELTILYVSGEESEKQIKLRADRLDIHTDKLFLASNTNADLIVQAVKKHKPEILVIDSIQTMELSEISSSPGSIVQVRECTSRFMKLAKTMDIPIFIIGHVNKDGGIAGPKILEHIVDTVLYFEGDRQLSYRILRSVKNRFGSTNEIGVFEMMIRTEGSAKSLCYDAFRQTIGVSGSSVVCSMEGTRPILAEIQALVTKQDLAHLDVWLMIRF